MDIVKQITILLWILGGVLIAPPLLRHFNIDVQQTYRKVLALPQSKSNTRDALEMQKTDIDPSVFQELFPDENEEESPLQEAKEELEKIVSGLEKESKFDSSSESLQGVPSSFRYDSNAQNKVSWLPPPPGFMTGETFNYLIYREQQPVGAKLKSVLDTIHGNLMLDLTPFTLVSKPNKILVMLFDNRNSYMNFTKRPAWSGAASDLRSDTMYVLEGSNFYPLTVHELTHLYFDGYFLPSISPLWLSEGMAVYMQIYATHQKPAWVNTGLRRILNGQYIDLENMMDMQSLASLDTEQAELWYTQAFSVVDYLLNSHSRDEFYRFCNELKGGAPVYQALYRAYGMPFNKVSVLQNVWLYNLNQKLSSPQPTAAVQAAAVAAQPAVAAQRPAAVAPQVLSSTQTVSLPSSSGKQNYYRRAPQKTVIPKMQLVETNGYKGHFDD